MIALIQRVSKAGVSINNRTHSSIGPGLVIFLGIAKEDAAADSCKLAAKIMTLRILPDKTEKMNKSVSDANEELLVVSQFTLCANLKGGRRPDFFPAMEPAGAKLLYEDFIRTLKSHGAHVAEGVFGARMKIDLINDGPVTFILDSGNL